MEDFIKNLSDTAVDLEKLAEKISDPTDAYRRLKALQISLKHCRWKRMNGEHERFISEEDEELKHIKEEIEQLSLINF